MPDLSESNDKQATEATPVRISDGSSFPALFDTNRFKVYDSSLETKVTSLISTLGDLSGASANSTNDYLKRILEWNGFTTWSVSGSVTNNIALVLTKTAEPGKIHVLTWIDVSYSGTGSNNRITGTFSGTTILRSKVDSNGSIRSLYEPGIKAESNGSIVITLPAITSQSSAGAIGGFTIDG